jgi:hypothetical protein
MTIVDKRKQKKLQMCNLTLNDKGSKILETYVNNISGTKILYWVTYVGVYNLPILYT